MNTNNYKKEWYDIDKPTYDWSVKAFRSFKKILNVDIKLHADEHMQQGDIFLFNHFSRFETFIPQFLIYENTGSYCWSVASSEFFDKDTVLAKYLRNLGVMPHDHPYLFPLLAKQILQGHKVIIFPEGGMVKDRQVMDNKGHFSILSQMTGERRKHHTGAAVLAQGLEAFKATIRNAYVNKDAEKLLRWKQDLKFNNLKQLLLAALKPTLIVPANITFYPIRSSDNFLLKSIDWFADGLSPRQTEELMLEGNIMFRDTDMDIRLGLPIDPYHVWNFWNHGLLELVSSEFNTLDEIFALHDAPKAWKQRLLGFYFKRNAKATRNQYMQDIYANVTINLSHLASTLIIHCVSQDVSQIDKQLFYCSLYLTIKLLRQEAHIKLHENLHNPDNYSDLVINENLRFEQFISVAEQSNLLSSDSQKFYFNKSLSKQYNALTIRMENLIAVYYNEARPIRDVTKAVIKAFSMAKKISAEKLAQHLFDDEIAALKWDRDCFSLAQYNDINQLETASVNPEPFLHRSNNSHGLGILLVHGLLASPAEISAYGLTLKNLGYTVLGIRIKGHGTSPHDLRSRSQEDWYASVERGTAILRLYCSKIIIVGFSTGGALALQYAAKNNQNIVAIAACAVPINFVDPKLMLLPLLHGANKLVQWLSSFEGVKPFLHNDTENPDINYQSVPVRSLFELRRLIQKCQENLANIKVPVLLIYAEQDPIVAANSADIIMNALTTPDKTLTLIDSNQHGILKNNYDRTWDHINKFIEYSFKVAEKI